MKASALSIAAGSLSLRATSWPARAKQIAQARPTKPAPTTATLAISERLHIAADADRLAGDIGPGARQQEHDGLGDVLGRDLAAQGHPLEIARLHLLVADAELPGA